MRAEIGLGALHQPEDLGSCPGVVLIHDVWGRSAHSGALAGEVARAGFAVVEIDLYRALDRPTVSDPGERIRALDDRAVLADLDAAADWLVGRPICRGRGIGVMGVCMGGTYALLAACSSNRFAASAPFYGLLSYDRGMYAEGAGRDPIRKPSSPIECASALRMPLLASFGREDAFVPEVDVDRLEAGLAKSASPWHVDRYAGAGHAFLNETRPDAHRPEAAALALGRVLAFFRERLA